MIVFQPGNEPGLRKTERSGGAGEKSSAGDVRVQGVLSQPIYQDAHERGECLIHRLRRVHVGEKESESSAEATARVVAAVLTDQMRTRDACSEVV